MRSILTMLMLSTVVYGVSAQSKSAIEFFDTTGADRVSKFGWSGSKVDGKFFITTPTDSIAVKNGNMSFSGSVTAKMFFGDGSGLTNLPTGTSGMAGPTGPQGPMGPTGPAGIAGATGPTGPIGLTGATGAAGANGATGSTGATGSAGEIGPTGPAGSSKLIAFGSVASDGTKLSGSSNFQSSSTNTPGGATYDIAIDGETYTTNGYTTVVTSTERICIPRVSGGGNCRIEFFNLTDSYSLSTSFHFVIFKN